MTTRVTIEQKLTRLVNHPWLSLALVWAEDFRDEVTFRGVVDQQNAELVAGGGNPDNDMTGLTRYACDARDGQPVRRVRIRREDIPRAGIQAL